MVFKTNCPNCGAPINYSKARCAYCDTPYFQQTNWDDKSLMDHVSKAVANNIYTPAEARSAMGLPPVNKEDHHGI